MLALPTPTCPASLSGLLAQPQLSGVPDLFQVRASATATGTGGWRPGQLCWRESRPWSRQPGRRGLGGAEVGRLPGPPTGSARSSGHTPARGGGQEDRAAGSVPGAQWPFVEELLVTLQRVIAVPTSGRTAPPGPHLPALTGRAHPRPPPAPRRAAPAPQGQGGPQRRPRLRQGGRGGHTSATPNSPARGRPGPERAWARGRDAVG